MRVAKTDHILHDLFLWNNPIPVNEARITSVKSKTSIENNIKDRFRLMDISAEITISLMGGMIKVRLFLHSLCFLLEYTPAQISFQ